MGKVIESLVEFAQELQAGTEFEINGSASWRIQPVEHLTLVAVTRAIEGGRIRIKPQLKKIDLSCLVGSGVLCEFWDDGDAKFPDAYPYIGRLAAIGEGFTPVGFSSFKHCRPLFNHWHHHGGGGCPIPDGFIIERMYEERSTVITYDYSSKWPSDVIAYRITGIAEGYEL